MIELRDSALFVTYDLRTRVMYLKHGSSSFVQFSFGTFRLTLLGFTPYQLHSLPSGSPMCSQSSSGCINNTTCNAFPGTYGAVRHQV